MEKNWTGERLETFLYNKNTIDHLHRYSIVNNYIKDKAVLDIACGDGYGSCLMADTAKSVVGVDIDAATVTIATKKYIKPNLAFKVGSADQIPVESSSIDVVVSFETIEHHDKHDEMLAEIKRVLKPDGLLIISSPDKLTYSDKRNYNNPYHVKELYKEEFVKLISDSFTTTQLLSQMYVNGNSIIQPENLDKIEVFSGDYSKTGNTEVDALYLIIIAGDNKFIPAGLSIFDGSKINRLDFDNEIKKVYNTYSYRIGNTIVRPFRSIKKILKIFS